MKAKKQNVFQLFWEQIQPENTTLSAAEQTRLSWARAIKSYEAVPEVFKAFFTPFVTEGQAFPYCVLSPSYEGFLYRASEKLVCDFGDAIHILEKSDSGYTAQCFPLTGINHLEVRTVLLDSRIKLSGVTQSGILAVCTLRFNTVTDYLFTPILASLRSVAVGSREAAERSELERFNAWGRASFKFMSYARRSLLGREKVLQAILQPEIRIPRLTLLGKTYYKTFAQAHASILTDRELIMIREELLHAGGGKYGGIWDYLPLNKISALTLTENENDLLVFSIHLAENERLEFFFQNTARPEIEQVLAQFDKLTEVVLC